MMEHLELLARFSYTALFLASVFEMETVVVLAAVFAANARYGFAPLPVVLVTTAGAFIGHIFFFWLGRTQGMRIVARFPHLSLHAGKAERFLGRHGTLTIFLSQYLVGLRIPLAILIGMSPMRWRRFLPLQLLSCLLWALACTVAGALFGNAIRASGARGSWIEAGIVAGAVLLSATAYLVHLRRDRKRAKGS